MSDIALEGEDFDEFVNRTDTATHGGAIACNDAFVEAMNRAIKRGREHAKPGVYVDTTPPIGAKRLSGILPMSFSGSPAAMCMESGGAHIGAQAMK